MYFDRTLVNRTTASTRTSAAAAVVDGPRGRFRRTAPSASPDGDAGKFVLDSRPARAIHHFDGWYVPINLDWFAGSVDAPVIHRQPFYWYVFAIPRRGGLTREHYFVCDYLKIREWVLDFAAPLRRDHRDHRLWRADLRIFPDDPLERLGYFRWGDEPVTSTPKPGRVFVLDNAATLAEAPFVPERVGVFGPGGESSAHRRLKLYVASHGSEFGMSPAAQSFVEHLFRTGDRVDVMFQNHWPERTVVEVEVAGEDNICTGSIRRSSTEASPRSRAASTGPAQRCAPSLSPMRQRTTWPQRSLIGTRSSCNR